MQNLRRPAVLRQYFGLDLDTPDLPPTGREDVVWRRTKLGIRLSEQELSTIDEWIKKKTTRHSPVSTGSLVEAC